ncbi:MAG: hypothetical protein ACWGSQ_04130, partial [Longimicrobiales bacterium]
LGEVVVTVVGRRVPADAAGVGPSLTGITCQEVPMSAPHEPGPFGPILRSPGLHQPLAAALLLPLFLLALGLGACTDGSLDPLAVENGVPVATAEADVLSLEMPPAADCVDGVIPGTGALVQACIPEYGWNGDLVVWAHGYVSPFAPLALPSDEVDGQPVANIVTGLGYGYATTSYRDNGLIADLAVDDLDDAVDFFEDHYPAPGMVYLLGGSEGGLATALSLERSAPGYDAGMVLCAPVWSFRNQIAYLGDFRVLLDAYFPDVVPGPDWGEGGVVTIDPGLIGTFYGWAVPNLTAAATAAPARFAELLRVAGVAFDPYDPSTLVESALSVLWYNIFATNDIIDKVGGLPYGNQFTWYRGSSNDWWLNRNVQRIRPTVSPSTALAPFETDGSLEVPAVGMHTTLDPIVPFSQGLRYRIETLLAGTGFGYNFLPVRGYGHCAFQAPQVLAGFALMVFKAEGFQLSAPSGLFADEGEEALFLATAREMGADPVVVQTSRRPRKR